MRSTFIEESGTISLLSMLGQRSLNSKDYGKCGSNGYNLIPSQDRVWGLDLSTYEVLVNAYEVCISYAVYSWGGQCFVQIITRLY